MTSSFDYKLGSTKRVEYDPNLGWVIAITYQSPLSTKDKGFFKRLLPLLAFDAKVFINDLHSFTAKAKKEKVTVAPFPITGLLNAALTNSSADWVYLGLAWLAAFDKEEVMRHKDILILIAANTKRYNSKVIDKAKELLAIVS